MQNLASNIIKWSISCAFKHIYCILYITMVGFTLSIILPFHEANSTIQTWIDCLKSLISLFCDTFAYVIRIDSNNSMWFKLENRIYSNHAFCTIAQRQNREVTRTERKREKMMWIVEELLVSIFHILSPKCWVHSSLSIPHTLHLCLLLPPIFYFSAHLNRTYCNLHIVKSVFKRFK